MKLGDLVQVKNGLHGWGSPGIIIKIDTEWKCPVAPENDDSLTIHILDVNGEMTAWYNWQVEVINETE